MIAYISYSLPDSDDDTVMLLSWKLKKQGFYADSGSNKPSPILDGESMYKIKVSHLFIGILMPTTSVSTASDLHYQRVINEWELALARKVPAILLMDERIQLDTPLSNPENIVLFDKYQPEKAIDFVNKAMEAAHHPPKTDKCNVAAWILGGDSVLALIDILAKTVQTQKAVAA